MAADLSVGRRICNRQSDSETDRGWGKQKKEENQRIETLNWIAQNEQAKNFIEKRIC